MTSKSKVIAWLAVYDSAAVTFKVIASLLDKK
jgi:hypothetical protein